MQSIPPSKFELPTIFVIFGITGDLMRKKILRSLYHLYIKKLLPERFKIYGFARRPFSDEEMQQYLKEVMIDASFPKKELYEDFLNHVHYVQGDFHAPDAYERLARLLGKIDTGWSVCSNKLFYLAVPPASYTQIIDNLHSSDLTAPCSPQEGWTRVILEKPFGTDLKTALHLDMQLGKLFREEQIYRVDHYLAKETVRNILAFRFGNVFLAPAWNKKWIEKIEIKMFEKDTVLKRGDFYDKVGSLRDVGQNHMLQLLALFIMDQPSEFAPEGIKTKRSRAIASLKKCTTYEIAHHTKRGQYVGYRQEEGVDADSQTETYFRIVANSSLPSFREVPLILESGKAMVEDLTEVVVTFRHPTSGLFAPSVTQRNQLIYRIRPQERISMSFLGKKPGFAYELNQHELGFDYQSFYTKGESVDDYEALLFDIIRGDQTLFVSTEEIVSQWKFIEPIVKEWQSGRPPLYYYSPHERF